MREEKDEESRSTLCNSIVQNDSVEVKFFPPLWQQRRFAITQILRSFNVKRVLDLGVGEGKLLQFLKNEQEIEELVGIDIDCDSLSAAEKVGNTFEVIFTRI